MKNFALIPVLYLLTSCSQVSSGTGKEERNKQLAHFFSDVPKTNFEDSSLLRDISTRLALFREKPLKVYSPSEPVIRFIYDGSSRDIFIIRIDKQQVVVKRAMKDEPGFTWRADSTQVSAKELEQLRIFRAYATLLKKDDPDTAVLLKSHAWLRDLHYAGDILDRVMVPGADSVAYTSKIHVSSQDSLSTLFVRADSAVRLFKASRPMRVGSLKTNYWTLEVLAEGKHQVIQRQSPNEGPFYTFGYHILRQYAQLKEDEIF